MNSDISADIPPESVIGDIRPMPSDPNMRSVRVGRRVVARLRAADIEALGLEVGQPFTPELASAVAEALELNKARKAALGLLSRRAYSSRQIIQRLTRRGHAKAIARRVIEQLLADGWLDDEAYAESLAGEIIAAKPAGQRLIVHKLIARGIDAELANRAAEGVLADRDLLTDAEALARKRLNALRGVPRATALRRIAGLLSRRGFDRDTIMAVLSRLEVAEEDDAESSIDS